jgi:hypothetical protein
VLVPALLVNVRQGQKYLIYNLNMFFSNLDGFSLSVFHWADKPGTYTSGVLYGPYSDQVPVPRPDN